MRDYFIYCSDPHAGERNSHRSHCVRWLHGPHSRFLLLLLLFLVCLSSSIVKIFQMILHKHSDDSGTHWNWNGETSIFSLLPAFLHIFLYQNSTCLGALCTFVVRTHCARHINLSYHYIYGRIYSLEPNGIECIQTYWLEQHKMKMASSSMAKKLKENHAIQLYGVENNWKYWMESEIIDYTFFCFDGVVYMGVSVGEWVTGCVCFSLHLLDSQWVASSSSRRFHSHSQKIFRRWYINWKMYFEFIYFIN